MLSVITAIFIIIYLAKIKLEKFSIKGYYYSNRMNLNQFTLNLKKFIII